MISDITRTVNTVKPRNWSKQITISSKLTRTKSKLNLQYFSTVNSSIDFEKDYAGSNFSSNAMFESMAGSKKGDTGDKNKAMFSLTFTYDFEFENDIVFFWHSFPYTATDWNEFLDKIDKKHSNSDWYKRDLLCNTLGGRPWYMLTITNNMDSYMTFEEEHKYFTSFQKEACLSQESQSISEIAKNGYKAGSDK